MEGGNSSLSHDTKTTEKQDINAIKKYLLRFMIKV